MPQVSSDAPILATKLFVPAPRDHVVHRVRLRERLAAARGGRVTLVAAAAGWGKSTLLAEWALGAQGRVAWLSLDPTDDEPRQFLSYVIEALRAAQCLDADERLDVLSLKPEAIRATATELLNAIAARGAPVSLVLDDYHVIESRDVHDAVQFLIDHLPPNLHLAIATRVDPPLTLSRLRARGLLVELRGSDLRFNADEAAAFLNTAMGLTLAPDEIAELEQRTEGWPVGLQMAAISLSGGAKARPFIERFSGSHRYVLDYLTDEVLDRQPADVRQFLLATSILTRLSPPLCNAVLQRSDSEAMLQQLDAANLFLIALDDVRYWYRYHHLFATLLQHQLARACGAGEIAELHQRASAWYEANGMPEAALDHALAANDVDRGVTIVFQHGMSRMFGGDSQTVVRWFDRIPKERVDNDLELLLARGMALLGDWQIPRAYICALRAIELLQDDPAAPRYGPAVGLRGAIERALGRHDDATEHLRRAVPLVASDPFWHSFVHYFLGMATMLEADAGGIAEAFAPVRARHQHPKEIVGAVLAQTFTAFGAWWRGEPDEAMRLANETFAWIDLTERLIEGRPLDALPLAVMATVQWSWNELAAARELAERAVERSRRGSIMPGVFEASRALAQVALAAREWDLAERAANDAQRAVRNIGNDAGVYDAATLVYTVRFRRWQSTGERADFEAVDAWFRTGNLVDRLLQWDARRIAGFHCDTPLLLAVRMLIEQERYERGVEILDAILPDAVRTARVAAQIENLIVRALLEARRGRIDEAIDAMRQALDLAAVPRYVRPFLDDGPSVRPVLERAASGAADRAFAGRVLASCETATRPAARTAEGLSERELEVLRLVASGASNQDAARKLFIAASTVKKHLENIYAKLAVGGRVEAIARAREMKLL
ncbi:MAG TPA: LuxR C-terminal-related transcriptional regulator [Thermoanaerobaculia bacterium]|nr:LuxR C-terminal-related transcriptional regulator [Thermoanaerobaculia bacterium]